MVEKIAVEIVEAGAAEVESRTGVSAGIDALLRAPNTLIVNEVGPVRHA
ncbi:hypothetical protein EGH22_10625 [Halomicroarcula sp. F28]|nr:hypothetical protein [Halomicroarcula salinisoli]MBX0286783.1 hypothetical protein [Halomicroarcula salinisoli]